jgi:hypothetical protein
MGEDDIPGDVRGGDQDSDQYPRRRLTVAQAADTLGVTVDAIRSRIKRETIEHVREEGRVYVILGDDQGEPSTDQGDDQGTDRSTNVGPDPREELVESLLDQVAYMREQLAEERQARLRADTIIAQLTQANAALARRVPEIEPPAPGDAPETAVEGTDRGDVPDVPPEQQEPVQRRSWWRRFFGFE